MHTRIDTTFVADVFSAVDANDGRLEQLRSLYEDLARGYRDLGDFAEVPLTQGYWAKVDKADLDTVLAHSWFATGEGTLASPISARAKISGRSVAMSRFLMGLEPNSELKVDHVNYDNLDNRRFNLRVVTNTESAQHRRAWAQSQEGSQYKGVYRRQDKNYKKPWRAVIKHNGKPIHLGFFSTQEQAALAYDSVVDKYHGHFGEKNFG